MILNDKILKNISLTGRLCYLFMCIEKYLVCCYPDKDWTPVANKCWQWTNVFWNEGCDEYSQIVPEFLLEFDNYDDTNNRAYDGQLSPSDYLILKALYMGITNGNGDDEIDQMLMLPIEFNNECECSSFCDADEPTITIINKALSILSKHNIEWPDIDTVSSLTVEHKNGWGDFMNSEHYSIIMRY